MRGIAATRVCCEGSTLWRHLQVFFKCLTLSYMALTLPSMAHDGT